MGNCHLQDNEVNNLGNGCIPTVLKKPTYPFIGNPHSLSDLADSMVF